MSSTQSKSAAQAKTQTKTETKSGPHGMMDFLSKVQSVLGMSQTEAKPAATTQMAQTKKVDESAKK